jgi:ATP-dependent RNA helicase DDX21
MPVFGRAPVVLVLTPTRELANQVKGEFTALAQTLTVFCIYGGVSYEPQGNLCITWLCNVIHVIY